MGVPTAIIVMIVLIMSMFAIAGFILFTNREKFTQIVDPLPPKKTKNNKVN